MSERRITKTGPCRSTQTLAHGSFVVDRKINSSSTAKDAEYAIENIGGGCLRDVVVSIFMPGPDPQPGQPDTRRRPVLSINKQQVEEGIVEQLPHGPHLITVPAGGDVRVECEGEEGERAGRCEVTWTFAWR